MATKEFPDDLDEIGVALADGNYLLVDKKKSLLSRFWTYVSGKITAQTNYVTSAMLRDSAALSVIGRSANSTGVPADIAAANDGEVLRRSGTTIGFGTVATAGIAANAVTDALLRTSAALSVIGRSANSTGNVADIAAANDGEVLRRSGTTLGFGTIATAGIADGAVTDVKLSTAIQNALNALVDTADPLIAYPSYQTINVTSRYTDFATVNAGFSPYNAVGSGTGNASAWSTAIAGRHGLLTLETGTTTTGSYFIGMNSFGVAFGSGVYRWRGDFWIPTASDGTDTFSVRAGFIDATSGECTDGVYFRYTHSVNGGRWEFVTRNNSTETATDTGVAGVAAIASMEIEVNADGTSANARINGTSVATNTTNIPTGATRSTGIGLAITKSAGTNNRTIIADLMGDRFERTTAI